MVELGVVTVIFGSIFMAFALVVLTVGALTAMAINGMATYLRQGNEVRRFEAESRLEQARLQGSIPVWVDRNDPMALAAWNRAVAETWRISTHRELVRASS